MACPAAIHDTLFSSLAVRRLWTAAAQLPLVIWRDEIASDRITTGYQHLDFFSLYLVRQGRGTHVIDGVPYAIARGDVYAMGLGQSHWFLDCHDLVTDTLHFAPALLDAATREVLAGLPGFQTLFIMEPLDRAKNGGRWLHLPPDSYSAITASMTELYQEWSAGTADGVVLTRALFLRLLIHLARIYQELQQARPQDAGAHASTLAAAVHYLETHFTEQIRISEVAARVFLSPDRFTEVFSATMGRTPRDYLVHLRLEHAKVLLKTTDLPIAEVGMDSGYDDAAYFTRAFRAAAGMTPREFRKMQEQSFP